MKEKEDVLLSVICTTYNHEKYIRQALDSILMQKVNFKYEVIVGEDCSPDNTREILKEYEKKYPDIFTMVYRDKNIGAKKNSFDISMRCKGKYIAYLECDDYWTDENKLQKQVDYLEAHPNTIEVAHRVVIVDEFSQPINDEYPECKNEHYTIKEYKKGILPGQTGSIVRRNYFKYSMFNTDILQDETLKTGDRVHTFLCVSHGDIHCIPEVMSAYRFITSHGTSYSAQSNGFTDEQAYLYFIKLYMSLLDYARKNSLKKKYIIASEELYFLFVVKLMVVSKNYRNKEFFFSKFKNLHYKCRTCSFVTRRMLYSVLTQIISKISRT